jgi:hypothetical protein
MTKNGGSNLDYGKIDYFFDVFIIKLLQYTYICSYFAFFQMPYENKQLKNAKVYYLMATVFFYGTVFSPRRNQQQPYIIAGLHLPWRGCSILARYRSSRSLVHHYRPLRFQKRSSGECRRGFSVTLGIISCRSSVADSVRFRGNFPLLCC